jgi:hypothetical protein
MEIRGRGFPCVMAAARNKGRAVTKLPENFKRLHEGEEFVRARSLEAIEHADDLNWALSQITRDPTPNVATEPAKADCAPCATVTKGPLEKVAQLAAAFPFRSSAGDAPGRGQIPWVMAKLANAITNRYGAPTVREVGYPAEAVA